MEARKGGKVFGMALVAVRTRKGVSQADVAARLKVKRPYVCKLEKRVTAPPRATVAKLARAIGVKAEEILSLAARLEGPTRLLPIRRATAAMSAAMEAVIDNETRLGTLEDRRGVVSATTLPLLHSYLLQPHSSEILAASLRDSLKVGTAAFADLNWTLEFANVRILALPLDAREPSAAWWNPERETLTVVVDSAATPERRNYRLAYELGAACLFRSCGNRPLAETVKAHRFLAEFAADFLMPAAAIADMVAKVGIKPGEWTMPQLLAFKSHFRVSAETFAFRLEELGLIEKPLRLRFRTELRAYYKKHPDAMEPKWKEESNDLPRMRCMGGGAAPSSNRENKNARRTGRQSQNDFGI